MKKQQCAFQIFSQLKVPVNICTHTAIVDTNHMAGKGKGKGKGKQFGSLFQCFHNKS